MLDARLQPRCSIEGGNIYFLAKFFSTDGKSFLQAVGTMTGMSLEDYAGDDDRRRPLARGPALDQGGHAEMARITAGVATSHVPALGAAIDLGKTARALLGAGLRRLRMDPAHGRRSEKPDVVDPGL